MACSISANDNRFYAEREASYGAVAAVTAANRFQAVRLEARQETDVPRRRDKSGTRTYGGVTSRLRRRTWFEVETYLVSRESAGAAPGYGVLVESALGGGPRASMGVAAAGGNGQAVTTSGAHGLSEGMAVTHGGEIRFVQAAVSDTSIVLNAPFTAAPGAGSVLGPAVSYAPAGQIPPVSVYDYWSPSTAMQRILRGAAVDELEMSVNGDYHSLTFRGPAVDVIDRASFVSGEGGLSQFPMEPEPGVLNCEPVPGHLGQVWIGVGPSRFHTLTKATVKLKNNLETRIREFGSVLPRCLVPGEREVTVEFELFSQDKASFDELYQSARWRQPISMMLQMGETEGHLFGIWLKSFVPEVPELMDDGDRLAWRFSASRAQGTVDDELYVAFG